MLATPQRTKVGTSQPFSRFWWKNVIYNSSPEGISRYTSLVSINNNREIEVYNMFFFERTDSPRIIKMMHLFLKFLGRIIVNRFSVVDPYPHLSLDNR